MDEALTCPCHGEPWSIRPQHHSTGGTLLRQCRVKKREQDKRYRESPHGAALRAETMARRVFVGRYYVGLAPTVEQAAQLNQQAKERFA